MKEVQTFISIEGSRKSLGTRCEWMQATCKYILFIFWLFWPWKCEFFAKVISLMGRDGGGGGGVFRKVQLLLEEVEAYYRRYGGPTETFQCRAVQPCPTSHSLLCFVFLICKMGSRFFSNFNSRHCVILCNCWENWLLNYFKNMKSISWRRKGDVLIEFLLLWLKCPDKRQQRGGSDLFSLQLRW